MRGEPWSIMYANVVNKLERVTMLHKYPITREETVVHLLPEAIKEHGPMWDNLRRAVKWECYTQCLIDHGKDVSLFWVADASKVWPTPTDPSDGFAVYKRHPYWQALSTWAAGASELDDWMDGSKTYLHRVLKTMKHPMWVEQFWPELVPFVGTVPETLTKGMREPRPTSLQLDMPLQDEIQNKLTLASLLPGDQILNAWIGRYPL